MLPQAEFQISDWIFRTPLKFWSGWYIKHPVWTRFIIAQNGSPDMVFLFYPYMVWYRHMDTGFRLAFGFWSWPQVKLTNLGQIKISFFQPPSSILCHGLIRKGTGTAPTDRSTSTATFPNPYPPAGWEDPWYHSSASPLLYAWNCGSGHYHSWSKVVNWQGPVSI